MTTYGKGRISLNKKTLSIPSYYTKLFPSMRCNLLASDNLMAIKDDPNGDLKFHKYSNSLGLRIISSCGCKEIRKRLNIQNDIIKLKAWIDEDSNILIFSNSL